MNKLISSQPFVLAIGGGSGAGKSTLIRELKKKIHEKKDATLCLLEQDHYYRDLSHLNARQRQEWNFDHPDAIEFSLFETHLAQLKAGKSIKRPTYDYVTHTRLEDSVLVEPAPLILVDGILSLYHENLRALFDMSLYIDAAPDIRFVRRLKRDLKERGRTLEEISDQYINSVRPMHQAYVEPTKEHADLIINGNHDLRQDRHHAAVMISELVGFIL